MASFPTVSEARLQCLERQFQANLENGADLGAAVSVWQGERELLHVAGGFMDRNRTRAWTPESLVPVWSCTKGLAAATTLAALEDAGIGLDTPVAAIWESFGQAAKEQVTLAEVLSHRAGLAALSHPPAVDDYAAVIKALEEEAPRWTTGHGYHVRTFGFLLDEIVRRVTGAASLGGFWREALAEPLGLDAWIGLPESEDDRVAELVPGRFGAENDEEARFYRSLGDRDGLTAQAFGSPRGLHSVGALNDPKVWRIGYPAFGGVASARGLAAFYGMLAQGGRCAGTALFNQSSLRAMESPLAQGRDQVFLRETAFAAGFMKDPVDAAGGKTRALFGPSTRAFGHPGAGGSLAFADPSMGIGFAYVMNQMERSVFPTEKALSLVACLYGETR